MNLRRPLTLLTLLLATAPAWALKPFVADYEANWKGVQANAQIRLSHVSGDRWNYELVVSNQLGNSRQTTVFELRDDDFRPLSGIDASQVLFKRTQKTASYDWARREARWGGDVKPDRIGPVKLEDGDLDGMLVNLALVRDVAAGKPLNYRLVDNGVARLQRFQILGKDTVVVAGQPHTAIKVSRTSEDKQIIVWIVEGLPTPARILQRRDGKDDLELVLKSVR